MNDETPVSDNTYDAEAMAYACLADCLDQLATIERMDIVDICDGRGVPAPNAWDDDKIWPEVNLAVSRLVDEIRTHMGISKEAE